MASSDRMAPSEQMTLSEQLGPPPQQTTLLEWLTEKGCQAYHDRLVAEGVTEVAHFTDLSEQDIQDMVKEWQMPRRPRALFLEALQRLRPPPYGVVAAESKQQTHLCRLHHEPVKVVCADDHELLCVICITTAHHGHKGQSIAEAASKAKREIQNARGRLQPLEAAIASAGEIKHELPPGRRAIEEKIRATFEDYRRTLAAREQALLANAASLYAAADGELEQKIEQFSWQQTALSEALASLATLAVDGQEIALLEKLAQLPPDKPLPLCAAPRLDCVVAPVVIQAIQGISLADNLARAARSTFTLNRISATMYVINIKAHNGRGDPVTVGGDPFDVILEGKDGDEHAGVIDQRDGTYSATFPAPVSDLRFSVILRGEHLPTSPGNLASRQDFSHGILRMSSQYSGPANTWAALQDSNPANGAGTLAEANSWIEVEFPNPMFVQRVTVCSASGMSGGWDASHINGASLQCFDPDTNQWQALLTIAGVVDNTPDRFKTFNVGRAAARWRLHRGHGYLGTGQFIFA